MTTFFKTLLCACTMLTFVTVQAQITAGRIVYERKTNLYKKYKDENVKEWLQEADKVKIDMFELYFNDSLSYFGPQESDLKEKFSWATQKNKVYQNFNANTLYTIITFWGDELHMQDTLKKRTWKILSGKRNIAGYECHKAMWQASDSVKVYAWYSNQINTSTGPESFNGLPGAILGLATEDGGVIYFAKQVIVEKPDPAQLTMKKTRTKVYTTADLKTKLEKDFGKEQWGKAMIKEHFSIW